MLRLVLLILSIVFFLLAACGVTFPRINFGWLGLACLAGAGIVPWGH